MLSFSPFAAPPLVSAAGVGPGWTSLTGWIVAAAFLVALLAVARWATSSPRRAGVKLRQGAPGEDPRPGGRQH